MYQSLPNSSRATSDHAMMCAGWIRSRASLMAMRRTSWIDHRINDDAAMVLFLPWFGVTKDRLLPPWTRIASRLRAHPTGLALLIAEQTLQKQACVPRNTFLPEQRTYPLLHLTKRRSP